MVAALGGCLRLDKTPAPQAVNGVIDLRQWDFRTQGPINRPTTGARAPPSPTGPILLAGWRGASLRIGLVLKYPRWPSDVIPSPIPSKR
jgi:hypothetical protein